MSEEIDLHQPLGTHIPGDYVYIEKFDFTHEMHIHQVLAVFTNQESPDAKIILTGEPERVKETSRGEAGQITFYSNVLLNAEIPVDAVPGLYKCGRVLAETVTGKLVAFDDPPNDTIDWELWVLVEPTTPPKFGIS